MYFNYSISKKKKFSIYVLVLTIFSLCFNQYFAYRGVFPIDSFFIFDAGYNITSGNHPFKDYWAITGPFLDYVQSLFYLIFGVNWFSYAFHASFLNMLLAVMTFYFFTKIGLNEIYAFIYAVGVSILAYPSIGTPFVDHHAVILCMLSIYFFSLGILLERNLFWFLTPVFLIFSFFSKQIPSAYLSILFSIIMFFYFFYLKNFNIRNLIFLFIGFLFSFLLVSIIFFTNKIPINNFLTQYIFYPASLGDGRIKSLDIDFKNTVSQFKFIYFALIPLLISIFYLFRNRNKNLSLKKEIIISLLFLGSIGVFIYSQLLTKNQILIFFLIPISAAFSHIYINKNLNKKYFIYFILIIFIFSTVKYHLRFNQNKKFMELIDTDINLAVDASLLDKRLDGLKWITPFYSKDPMSEINLLIKTKNTLLNKKGSNFIITDYQFFSSLLKNEFASPNKFYDNQSIPNKKNKYYEEHKIFFINNVKNKKIEYLYFIGKQKHKLYFFQELVNENKCINSSQLNEILIEFDISKCKLIK